MAYNYGYTTNSDGWPMWTTNMQAYRSEFIQLYQGAPQNQRNQHQHRQLQDQRLAQQIQSQGLQSEPPFAAFEPMSLLYSSNRQDRGQSAAYNYPQYMPLQSTEALPEPTFALPYGVSSTTQLELTPVHAQVQVLEQRDEKEPFRSLEEEYAQYGISLCTVFDHIRQGRLIDASRLLLEISKWLVNNLQGLGFLYADRADLLPLWNDFNNCWLALFQKQLDMKHDLVATKYMPTKHSLLTLDRMEAMGNELIQLCDQLESHGLVDYQMGILEEDILSILGQCLDSMEQPLRAQTNARMTRRS